MYDNKDGRIRGARGVAIRAAFLAKHPLCAECQRHGRVTAAEEVDHIKPLHSGGKDIESNKQGLCKECHKAKSAGERGADLRAQMFPEWLAPAACHLTIVFGPPGSGKSAHVERHRKAGDQVIDLDAIRAELSGEPIYTSDKKWLSPAVRERNRRLGALKRIPPLPRTWFVVTGVGEADREWWKRKLQPAAVVVLDTPEATCIARIRADARRPDSLKEKQIAAVKAWWDAESGYAATSARRVVIGLDGWPTP